MEQRKFDCRVGRRAWCRDGVSQPQLVPVDVGPKLANSQHRDGKLLCSALWTASGRGIAGRRRMARRERKGHKKGHSQPKRRVAVAMLCRSGAPKSCTVRAQLRDVVWKRVCCVCRVTRPMLPIEVNRCPVQTGPFHSFVQTEPIMSRGFSSGCIKVPRILCNERHLPSVSDGGACACYLPAVVCSRRRLMRGQASGKGTPGDERLPWDRRSCAGDSQ